MRAGQALAALIWLGGCAIAQSSASASSASSASSTLVNTSAERLAATCATCHGTNGQAVGSVFHGLAGRDEIVLRTQLRDFRAGRTPSTVMHQLTKGYTDQELVSIAAYFSRLAPLSRSAYP